MKPFHFVLPESFDPREFLGNQNRARWDDARYFVSLILTKLAHRDVDLVDGVEVVRLHAKHLRNIMHQSFYASVIDALVKARFVLDGPAIERFPYRVGERSFGFRLAARFINDRHARVPATDPRLIKRLTAFHQQADAERQTRMKPVHFALCKQQLRLRIHGDKAREILAGLPRASNPFDTQGILVRDIENREFRCNVGRYGRVTNNITSLKRELRKMLHVADKPLVSVDLSCAQPAIVARLLTEAGGPTENESIRSTEAKGEIFRGSIYDSTNDGGLHYDSTSVHPATSDLERFRRLTQTGRFYDFMVNELAEHDITRDEFKKRFLADVVAKKKANARGSEYHSIVEDKFRELFPTVYRFIRRVNSGGWEHANMIRRLQQAESELVIETVCADLVARYPGMFLITLHDAIYSTPENLPTIEQAFHRAFDVTGYSMTLKTAV